MAQNRGDKQPSSPGSGKNGNAPHPQMPAEKAYGSHPTAKTVWRDDMLVNAVKK